MTLAAVSRAAEVIRSHVQAQGMKVKTQIQRRQGCVCFVVLVTMLVMSAPAVWAQEDEPAINLDPAEVATPEGQALGQGLVYAEQENHRAASMIFYRLARESHDTSDTILFRAEYELAKTLYQMRLFYASLYFFDEIVSYGPDHPLFIATLPWLLRLHRRLPGETHMLERIAQYTEFFPDQIEDKYLDQVAYTIGRYNYLRGHLEESQEFLRYVSSGSRYYVKARYLQGVSFIQQYRGQEAVDGFRDVIGWVLEADERTDETRELAELAVLSVARTFYSTGEYDKAVRWYDQVPLSSPHWLDALFEKAWALFQIDEYNRALGNLHSLNSPFFDDEFYPEGMILQAVIFFRNCNYDAVRETVEEFKTAYVPFLDQLEDMAASMVADEDYYDLVLALRGEQERDFSPQLQQILNASIDSQHVGDAIAFVQELDRELRVLEGMEESWRDTGLGDDVEAGTGLARSVAAGRAGGAVRMRIDRAREELENLLNQADAILVETDLVEQAIVNSDIRSELNLADTGLLPPPSDSEHLLWHFRGEYWRDELGYYWYAIRSRCADVGF